MTGRYERIAFVASLTPEAEKARDDLMREYGGTSPEQADVIVALGGDGLMLQTLHKFMSSGKPIYGMNRGTIGFLMNEFHLKRLRERLAAAETTITHPLVMHAVDVDCESARISSHQRGLAVPRNLPGREAAGSG